MKYFEAKSKGSFSSTSMMDRRNFIALGIIPDEYWRGVDQLARVVDYGVNLVGEGHVALGSGFDGGVALPKQIRDVSDYPEMIKAVRDLGYSDQRIRKICGLN